MEVNEILRDVKALHLFDFQNHCFAMLGLVESGVIIGDMDGIGEVSLTPGGKLERGVAGMDVNVGGAIGVIEEPLVLFDWSEEENNGVVHEGEGLASFPASEDGTFIDLVLSFGENFDGSVTPIRVRARGVGHDN